jgi:hypothetical protein
VKTQGLNVCPIPVLGFEECPTNDYGFTGKVLSGNTWNFGPAITQPYWALGFEMLGKQYDQLRLNRKREVLQTNLGINAQQAIFFSTLLLYNATQVNSTTAQFTDAYETESGLVETQFQVAFNLSAMTITVQNLFTQLPQGGGMRACNEVLTSFWKAFVLNFSSPPTQIQIPYPI